MNTTRKVIFLDIDGVLQPLSSQKRFDHDLDDLCKQLAETYQDDEYLDMDKYDLGAVYYDWDKEAVERLRSLCEKTGAEIVISSSWRVYSPLSRLKEYFRLHDLDTYITGETPRGGTYRHAQIQAYLEQNPDIERFVILDDAFPDHFEEHFPDQFVFCRRIFNDDNYQKALEILSA